MASTQRKVAQRRQLRDNGYKQLEVWLPRNVVERIDEMKDTLGAESRNEVLLRLIEGTLGENRLPADRAQLELRMQ
ncbi:hypothetical protein [Croceicoccus marinus]|uniref:Ribbon-helix-helix protein CopG domain-containing protein n=1 Tax=Croceicoccus marinus TaxID=450378 RepID=A0A7G6W1B8_9SPHN|nr:hypothetical protein [Croceicoccus marinus]QNE07783.1 hypothetical protein H4O24_19755 [Croceicoccus marinus]